MQCSFIEPLALASRMRNSVPRMQSSMHMAARRPRGPAGEPAGSEGEPDAPHAEQIQHKAACAVACALHRAAGYDAGSEHRLCKSLDAEDLRTQRDDGGICREDAHEAGAKSQSPAPDSAMMPMPIMVQSQANRFAMSRRWRRRLPDEGDGGVWMP